MFMPPLRWLAAGCITLVWVAPALALDITQIETHIFQLTNAERSKAGLAPFRLEKGLDQLARAHSQRMAQENFFSHTDPDGRGPGERKAKFYPQLLGGIGENIVQHYGQSEAEIARNMVTSWMKSPGHRANILSTSYSHLGIGVAGAGNAWYGTQNFADASALLLSPLAPKLPAGTKLRFQFMGNWPREELTLFMKAPNAKARFYTSGGSFYTGTGPLIPRWLDATTFEIELPSDKGSGTTLLMGGRNGSFYPQGITFELLPTGNVSALPEPDLAQEQTAAADAPRSFFRALAHRDYQRCWAILTPTSQQALIQLIVGNSTIDPEQVRKRFEQGDPSVRNSFWEVLRERVKADAWAQETYRYKQAIAADRALIQALPAAVDLTVVHSGGEWRFGYAETFLLKASKP